MEYFDFYLMHAQDKRTFEKYKACRAYEIALELKAEGKEDVYVVTCFSDRDKLLAHVEKEG
mgnify:CR=1 FL=1